MLKYYLEIVKPGIVFGNLILITGSFFFASRCVDFNICLFLYTILGGSLVIASACVCNNLIDRDIDIIMIRTSNRILSKNLISLRCVLMFAFVLGILGIFILGFLVNYLSMMISIFGFFTYVILYTWIYKRKTIHSTLIGSFSGSTPSMIGYVAVSNTLDLCSILLFIIIIFWQMSHFYSISIFRRKDYKNANIPIFSVVKGLTITKKYIFFYILSFFIFSSFLTFLGYLSYVFLFLFSIINLYWLFLSYSSLKDQSSKINSYQLFCYSILVIFVFNFLIAIDKYFE